ncbi:phytanoyl-CoA dioxygenase family protein [Dictyobacter aurantiacus]|uniref:SnoK n=1 Tax=Dictyobacter aurantiacus TaxID=1936993 RepID=A0A401ZEE2_9CHLR|nr:phytanoyl-CoA dioxygenase family protein [Dictyobacter aurantiacus]GCE05193.1 SnoK [Dictyobacter aurantiacus]
MTTTTYPISEEQVQFYQENGYIQLLNVLTADELAQARQALDEVMEQQLDESHDRSADAEYRKIFVQKVNLWQVHGGVRRYVFNARLAEIARRLARAQTIRLWHDHALIKMPGDSKASSWHQDIPYWPMQEDGSLSCWMALDDVYVENGCMAFIPGSHRLGRLEPINLKAPQDLFKLVPDEQARELNLDFTPRFQPMPAGSCTFHDGRTFHYAGPNQSDRPRRAIITIYMPDEVHFSGKPHIVTDDLQLTPGAALTGERFPILAP